MKLIYLLMPVLLMACGKNDGSGGSSKNTPQERSQGFYLDAKSVSPTELMNVTLSEAAEVRGDTITFSRNRVVEENGGRHVCRLSVDNGESWRFSVNGNTLHLQLPNGKNLSLRNLYSAGGHHGAWEWKGQEDGMRIQRRFTFLPGMVVVNQDCEG